MVVDGEADIKLRKNRKNVCFHPFSDASIRNLSYLKSVPGTLQPLGLKKKGGREALTQLKETYSLLNTQLTLTL
jgi:hypothetical protein